MQNWAAFRLGHGGAVRGMIPAQAPYEGGEPTMRKGSYSEELVWMSRAMLAHLSRKPAILLKSSVTQLRVVIVGASMRTPPGESTRRRQGPCCDSKRWTQLHTPSPPWTPSVRVDVEPRAPSDCQFRHWRALPLGNQGLCKRACIGHNGLGPNHIKPNQCCKKQT